ncbi:MAG: hypothetical protein BHW61_01265 [Sutterella sp. 63_29]|nr:MAG: hypothetical protein BHW61_01265 [Sutterella sp. 63_29]
MHFWERRGFGIVLSPDACTSSFNHNVLGVEIQCRHTIFGQNYEAVTTFCMNQFGFCAADHGLAIALDTGSFRVICRDSFESNFLATDGEVRFSFECFFLVHLGSPWNAALTFKEALQNPHL